MKNRSSHLVTFDSLMQHNHICFLELQILNILNAGDNQGLENDKCSSEKKERSFSPAVCFEPP